MLYVCIPVHDEAATIGVLLWRLRTVLGDAGRDYEVVVYDDGSTDDTAAVLAPYQRVLPLTVLGGPGAPRRGRSAATEALVRHVVAHSRYPRRDACVVLQGDFTDRPDDLPTFLTAFEAGADLVVGRRPPHEAQPFAERRLRRMGPWVLRPLVRVDGVDDLLGSLRLTRVAVLRDVARTRGAAPLIEAPGWAGVVEWLVAVVPFARRIDVVDAPGRYDVRPRASRRDWAAELRALARFAWRTRGTVARPGTPRVRTDQAAAASDSTPAPDATAGSTQPGRAERPRRAERPSSDRVGGRAAAAGDRQHDADAAAVERPRTRRARTAAAAVPAAAARAPTTAADAATPELPVVAPTRRTSRPPDAEGALVTADDSGSDTPAVPARRKKRRTRRRSRNTGADAGVPESSPQDQPLEADDAGVPDVTDARAPGQRAARAGADAPNADATDAHTPDADVPDAAESGDAAGASTPGRRRKRRRSRSGERSSGVTPLISSASPTPGDRSDAPSPRASAPGEPLSDPPPSA